MARFSGGLVKSYSDQVRSWKTETEFEVEVVLGIFQVISYENHVEISKEDFNKIKLLLIEKAVQNLAVHED
jgi:hypothetical protein